jgi:quinol monooxygenase YgiN
MSDEIAWLVELAVKPGQLDAFQALTGEMVATTQRESGVLNYERFISHDGTTVYACERYADSKAALAHLATFDKIFGRRFVDLVERRRFTVFGTPTDELKRVLDRFGVVYVRRIASI